MVHTFNFANGKRYFDDFPDNFTIREETTCDSNTEQTQVLYCENWPKNWMMSDDVLDACNYSLQTKSPDLYEKARSGILKIGGPVNTCYGWDCDQDFDSCPPDRPGSNKVGKCCINKKWEPGVCRNPLIDQMNAMLAREQKLGMKPEKIFQWKGGQNTWIKSTQIPITSEKGCYLDKYPDNFKIKNTPYCLTNRVSTDLGGRTVNSWTCDDWPSGWTGENTVLSPNASQDVIRACDASLQEKAKTEPSLQGHHFTSKSWSGTGLKIDIEGDKEGCWNTLNPGKFTITDHGSKCDGDALTRDFECTNWPKKWTGINTVFSPDANANARSACNYSLKKEIEKGTYSTELKELLSQKTGDFKQEGIYFSTRPVLQEKGCENKYTPVEQSVCKTVTKDGNKPVAPYVERTHQLQCVNWPSFQILDDEVIKECNKSLDELRTNGTATVQQASSYKQQEVIKNHAANMNANRMEFLKQEKANADEHKIRTRDAAKLKGQQKDKAYKLEQTRYTKVKDSIQEKYDTQKAKTLKLFNTVMQTKQPASKDTIGDVVIPSDVKFARVGASQGVWASWDKTDPGCWNEKYPGSFQVTDQGTECKTEIVNGRPTGATFRTFECTNWPDGWSKSDDAVAACNHSLETQKTTSTNPLIQNMRSFTAADWGGPLGDQLQMSVKDGASGCWNTQNPDNFTNTYRGEECQHGSFDGIQKYECTDWPGSWSTMSKDVLAACNDSLSELRATNPDIPENAQYHAREHSSDPASAGLAIGTYAYAEFKGKAPKET